MKVGGFSFQKLKNSKRGICSNPPSSSSCSCSRFDGISKLELVWKYDHELLPPSLSEENKRHSTKMKWFWYTLGPRHQVIQRLTQTCWTYWIGIKEWSCRQVLCTIQRETEELKRSSHKLFTVSNDFGTHVQFQFLNLLRENNIEVVALTFVGIRGRC